MKIADIIKFLENTVPLGLQEDYDNSGLICGDKNLALTNALISLDCTEEIIEEAIQKKCNLVISHHPIVFKGLKKITGKNYVERTILKAIKNDIAIYAIHTNLDNYNFGVNFKIGQLLGVQNQSILKPLNGSLQKLITFAPTAEKEKILDALFEAGAGNIGNYNECSFSVEGTGTFKGNDKATPYVGDKNKRHYEAECRIEVIMTKFSAPQIIETLLKVHPYEEVAYDVMNLENKNHYLGAGMIGELSSAIELNDFLNTLKLKFQTSVIRYSGKINRPIKKIAWCGGAGIFLLNEAKRQKADIFITGDVKYHDFFDAENQLIIADIGHFESEQYTIEHLRDLLKENFPNFAPSIGETNTNPVKYFI